MPLLLCATLWAGPDETGKPVVVHLKSGRRVPGRIVAGECTDELLVLREFRTDAKRTLKWADLKPKQAHELRVELGFEIKEAGAGMQIRGHEIVTRAGAKFRGLLVNRESAQRDGVYVLKTSQGERRIRLVDVRSGPDEVELDALEVYTPLELYARKLKEKTPVTAEDHFRLAEFAAAMGALEPAKMHYEKVLALADKKYSETLVRRLLERVVKRLGNVEAEGALRSIREAIWRKKWKAAGDRIAAFREKYQADETLLKVLARLEEDLRKRRQAHFTQQIPRLLRDTVKTLVARKAREPEITLRIATGYAGGESNDEKSVSHEALAAVGQKLGIKPEEVLEFWSLRSKRAIQKAFYKGGTFIVVENLQDALAKAPKAPRGNGKTAIKPPKPHPVKTPDGWWNGKVKARKFSELRDWLYAWWAEKSGMVELMEPKTETCPTCAGKGYTQSMVQTSQGMIPFFDRCQTCYMSRVFRVVRFK